MLYKRKDTKNWYFGITINGSKIYRSTGTSDRAKAEEIAAKLHTQLFNQVKLGEKPKYLWQEAVIRWVGESEKKSINTDKVHLRWLSQHLDDIYLHDITKDKIEQIITEKQRTGVSNTRVNRTTEVIRAILNKANKEWQWIDTVPHIRRFKEPNASPRWITIEEAARLLEELPDHMRSMAAFTLATGLRQSNVTGLQWSRVNLADRLCWIEPNESKNGRLLRVELNEDAIEILKQQRFKHQTHVFHYQGHPIANVSTKAWYAALKRANIDDFRWHDLRHTWSSWHVQNGTPLAVLKDLGHWQSFEIVLRYAHLAPQHLQEYTKNVSGLFEQNRYSAKTKQS